MEDDKKGNGSGNGKPTIGDLPGFRKIVNGEGTDENDSEKGSGESTTGGAGEHMERIVRNNLKKWGWTDEKIEALTPEERSRMFNEKKNYETYENEQNKKAERQKELQKLEGMRKYLIETEGKPEGEVRKLSEKQVENLHSRAKILNVMAEEFSKSRVTEEGVLALEKEILDLEKEIEILSEKGSETPQEQHEADAFLKERRQILKEKKLALEKVGKELAGDKEFEKARTEASERVRTIEEKFKKGDRLVLQNGEELFFDSFVTEDFFKTKEESLAKDYEINNIYGVKARFFASKTEAPRDFDIPELEKILSDPKTKIVRGPIKVSESLLKFVNERKGYVKNLEKENEGLSAQELKEKDAAFEKFRKDKDQKSLDDALYEIKKKYGWKIRNNAEDIEGASGIISEKIRMNNPLVVLSIMDEAKIAHKETDEVLIETFKQEEKKVGYVRSEFVVKSVEGHLQNGDAVYTYEKYEIVPIIPLTPKKSTLSNREYKTVYKKIEKTNATKEFETRDEKNNRYMFVVERSLAEKETLTAEKAKIDKRIEEIRKLLAEKEAEKKK